MAATATKRPFTTAMRALRADGARFLDLEIRAQRARSTAWFNNLDNSADPWRVTPPTQDTFTGLCNLFGVTEDVLRQWIATEWYGVSISEQSARVRSLAPAIDSLTAEDAALVESLAARLASSHTT